MISTNLVRAIKSNNSASQSDLEFIGQDNQIAHNVINEILKSVIEKITNLESRLENLEKHVTTEITSPANIRYRPDGLEEHLSLKENLDLIYERLNNLKID